MTNIHTDTAPFPTRGSTLDRAADKIFEAGAAVPPAVERVADRATEVARQGAQKLTDGTQQVKVRLNEVSDSAIAYVKDEPVRAMLIAAGVGAALMALAGMLGRARHH